MYMIMIWYDLEGLVVTSSDGHGIDVQSVWVERQCKD
jgi:hypothetical protein